MKNNDPDRNPAAARGKKVGAAVATLAIVRHLCHASGSLRLIDIADPLGLNRSTVHNILRTLVEEDFLTFDPAQKAYRMTAEIGRLAEAAGFSEPDANRRLFVDMQLLAKRFEVNISFWAMEGDRLVLKQVAESPSDVRISQTPGQRVPLLQGAIGRVVAAALDLSDLEIGRRFEATTFRTAQDLGRLLEDVRAARLRGWSEDGGSSAPGTTAVAVPIFTPGGPLRGACAALMMTGQFDRAKREAIASALLEVTRKIEISSA